MKEEQIASKCYDIQVSLSGKEVPEFELIPKIGMMVSLALHLRGLPIIDYDKLRLVSSYYFKIPPLLLTEIIKSLAEIEFVKLYTEKDTIKKVQPQVPYFDSIYEKVGEYAVTSNTFNEPENLALKIITKLSDAPTEISNMYGFGAEKKLVDRNLNIGSQGGYILNKRARGKDILISPLFFSENADVFADLTAKTGSKRIQKVLQLIKDAQGWPLSIIEKTLSINGQVITVEDFKILKRLAQDGAVKPPSITTGHSGQNYFLFTPAPGNSKLNPSKREIYERAMAIVASVRQGQLLSNKYPIRYPVAILNALKRDGWLRPTSETYAQYHQLAIMKVGRLEKSSSDKYRFVLIPSEENMQALALAISLVEDGKVSNMEISTEAQIALQNDQTYIESIISSSDLRKTEIISLDEEAKEEFNNILLKGI